MSRNLELTRFATDTTINFVRILLLTALGILTSAIIARALGRDGKGIYEVALILPITLQALFNLGVPSSTTYYVARREYDLLTATRGTIAISLWLGLLGIMIALIILAVGNETLFPNIPPEFLLLSLPLLPLLYLRYNLGSILNGLEDYRAYSLIELAVPVVTLSGYVILILVADLGIMGAILSIILGDLAAAIVAVAILKRRIQPEKKFFTLRLNRAYLRQIRSYGLNMQFSVIVVFLLLKADIYLLNIIGAGAASVGVYSIAVLLADRVWTFSGIASQTIMPRIASWKDEEERRNQLTVIATRYTLWLSLLAALGILLLGEQVIVLIFGSEFQGATTALFILLPGIILFNLGRVMGGDMAGRGRTGLIALSSGVAFMINIIANFFLIPRYDFLGAALASTLAYGYHGIFLTIAFYTIHKPNWLELWLPTHDDFIRMQKVFHWMRKTATGFSSSNR